MRFVLRMLGAASIASAIAVACGGSEFSSENAPKGGAAGSPAKGGGGGSDSGAAGDSSLAGTLGAAGTESGSGGTVGGTAGSAGTAGGGTTLCSEAKDCDDQKPCTLDTCLESGVCDNSPKCGGDTPACCNGVCSQCCGMGDCDDGLECTDNSCFAGVCNYQPTDRCDPGFYCSTDPANAPSGCLPIEDCDSDADCDDPDPCTADSCVDHKCTHPTCPSGGSCCPGLGCGSCCGDSQCPQDACNPSTCSAELKCEKTSLCAVGDRCCESPDGQSAQCGSCCESTDCPDDGVGCTDEKCKASAGGFLSCLHEPNPDNCPLGQACDPRGDCTANECNEPGDCGAPPACKTVSCDSGTCRLGDVSCSNGQQCCALTGHCQGCCDNKGCQEVGLARCCMPAGTCGQCCDNSDCQVSMTTGGAAPQSLVGGVGGGDVLCPGPPLCKEGMCVDNSQTCTATQKCCPGVGCVPLTQLTCPVIQ
jgi:hypothetical protein